jgi:glycosyltransferase involved in cell wall biosynthesis
MASDLAVLMAAYNSEATIQRAVKSVIDGNYPCDLFIVDDGSRIPVADVVATIPNLHVIRLAKNQGLAGALNVGLEQILERPYKYIARMDADDVSRPDRLAKQIAFLEQHPKVGAVGTWGRHFNERTGETTIVNRTPVSADDVVRAKYFNSPIIHASSMIRADVFRNLGLLSTDYPAAEDYELFRRIAMRYDIANLPEVLIDICESTHGISLSRRRRQLYDRLRIQLKYFDALEWRAWAGVAKTLLLFLVPQKLVAKIKIICERLFFRI